MSTRLTCSIAIYKDYIRHDVGKTFVMNFEWALNAWIGNPSPVCIHSRQCGRSLVIEHNGDVYGLLVIKLDK
ncbi:MAG: hypothetical protein MUE70_02940 [Desulfobacterales bacterium]|nr:hypothetical protein [Desulfobacterales bacterium]